MDQKSQKFARASGGAAEGFTDGAATGYAKRRFVVGFGCRRSAGAA